MNIMNISHIRILVVFLDADMLHCLFFFKDNFAIEQPQKVDMLLK